MTLAELDSVVAAMVRIRAHWAAARGAWARNRALRAWLAVAPVLALAWPSVASAEPGPSLYQIDQRYGTIEFTVTNLGLFSTKGRFTRFTGQIEVDPDHPERTRVDVVIEGNSVEMPLKDEVDMLRSAAYFDTARYPTERFVSSAVEVLSPKHYVIRGALQVRGVTRPLDLDAVMTERHSDPARHVDWADFVINGRMRRSAYGMVADQTMVSDAVGLDIRIRITVQVAAAN
jgi:polyisoprenoid-binding protein YceI